MEEKENCFHNFLFSVKFAIFFAFKFKFFFHIKESVYDVIIADCRYGMDLLASLSWENFSKLLNC